MAKKKIILTKQQETKMPPMMTDGNGIPHEVVHMQDEINETSANTPTMVRLENGDMEFLHLAERTERGTFVRKDKLYTRPSSIF